MMLLLLPFRPIITVLLWILIGEQPWQMSFRLWLTMVLGALFLGPLELMWSPASGFLSINIILMVLLLSIRPAGLSEVFHSNMEVIMTRLSVLW